MKKVVNIKEAQMISMMKNMSAEEILTKMCDESFIDEMKSICPDDMLHWIMESEKISQIVTQKVAKAITHKHGRITANNPPTKERRDDYYALCMNTTAHILGRALAMYEQDEREQKLKEFNHLAMLEAIHLRHRVDADHADD